MTVKNTLSSNVADAQQALASALADRGPLMRCSECAHRIACQVGDPPGHPCPRCCANTTEAHPQTGAGGPPSSPREADPWSTERTR